MRRTEQRRAAVVALYQQDLTGRPLADVVPRDAPVFTRELVEGVEIVREGALKPFQMAVGGVLIRIGVEPNTELFREQVHVDERGYIVTTGEHETEVENVFAVGDVSNPRAPTISGATGAGATAAKVIAARLNGGGRR